jgi:hypothetical protein
VNWRLFLLLISLILLHCSAVAQINQDSIAATVMQELTSQTSHAGAVKFYKKHLPLFRNDPDLFSDVIEYFLKHNLSKAAGEVLKRSPFLHSQHDEQALYYYYLGVTHMLSRRGWPNFKRAERSLDQAVVEIKRAPVPDYGFFSDLENARGYLSITARGESTDEEKDLVCIVRPEFMYMAVDHFRDAIIYNPNNQTAKKNLDTLIQKLREADLPIPSNKYERNVPMNTSISLDSVNADSLNDNSLIPVLNYGLLPNNYLLILSELQAYDEILLVLDLSGSMDDPVGWGMEASKFRVAQQLSIYVASKLRSNVFLGAVSVGKECDTSDLVLNYPIASVSRQELTTKIDAIRPYGHTPLNKRLRMTQNMFSAKQNKKLVFLLSDGMDTCGETSDLCRTAAVLAANGIDLMVFSFIFEELDTESRNAYSVYNCMVHPSKGKVLTVAQDGGVEDNVKYVPVSKNILVLPQMDTSYLWRNNPGLYQFDIKNVEPPAEKIIKFKN